MEKTRRVKRRGSVVKQGCPRCRSEHVWAKGVTPTRQGHKPRAVCYTCGKTFFYTPVGGVK